MAEELRTRVCAACGFPAVAEMRRCPFCREAFPRVRVPVSRRLSLLDPLSWLAIAWLALTIPVALLALVALGAPLAFVTVMVCLAPACFAWMLRGRTLARMRRLNRRRAGGGPSEGRFQAGKATGSEQPPSDARRR